MKALLFPIIALLNCSYSFSQKPADYVNPLIGASTSAGKAGVFHGLGKTFPGAATPFGLVQVSPNTITGGDNGSGYSYEHTSIEGFAFTQMSGVGWYGDLGNFLVTPSAGPLKTSPGRMDHPGEGYRLPYNKKSEKVSAGYYSVELSVPEKAHPQSSDAAPPHWQPSGGSGIRAEMTAAPHSGILRFTFPANPSSSIQIDLARRVGGTSTVQYIQVKNDSTICGWMKCTPEGGGWGNGDGKADYIVYFFAQFSKPLRNIGVWSADIPDDWGRKREDIESDRYRERVAAATVLPNCKDKTGKHLGFYTRFATHAGEQVLLKTGISFVSIQGAENNLHQEIKDWNFDKVHAQAIALWNNALGKISVEGGSKEEKTVFYTALYHTLIDPRTFSDADGKYPGGDGQVHQSPTFTKRTIFSGWDVFRSQFPLQTIINPRVVSDMLNSLVGLATESGKHYLERWEFLNAYSGCMIGNPAVAVMADAYAKGIRNFDLEKGYEYARNSCEQFGNGAKGYTGGENSLSKTLEYAYSDWCLSQLAANMGHKEDQDLYATKALAYRNIFNDSVGWFRPRKEDGSWEDWPKEGHLKQDYGTVESNPYQQGWFVPQDIPGMVKLMGGTNKTIADLTDLFKRTRTDMMWNDYYNHANEPVHHVAFLFNRLGAPWLTQQWTRAICQRAYHNTVEGLVGNEDVGQMSAWYVLAATGLHPVCPGDTRYEITSPVFSRSVIQLDPAYAHGKTFAIIARNNSPENTFIQGALLNGRPYDKCWLDHADIMAGGVLELTMGNTPQKNWGISQPSPAPLVWNQPGKDFHDALPLGNGDIGISAWAEEKGELLFYLSKTDAYDDNNRLLKLGKVRVKISPNPFAAGNSYREELNTRQGEMTIHAGTGAHQLDLRIWVDANHPLIHIDLAGKDSFNLQVVLENNRTTQHIITDTAFSDPFANSIDGSASTIAAIQYPDTILTHQLNHLVWYHHNTHSCWPEVLRLQGLEELTHTQKDPLQDRIFGGCISGLGLHSLNDTTLITAAPSKAASVRISLLTLQPSTVPAWLDTLKKEDTRFSKLNAVQALTAHREWWRNFWDRSWIQVHTAGDTGSIISRGYTLQRYLIACGGRGRYWTKFNGSIFTLPWEKTDPDFRRWGSANWFQNVRLPYWPLLAGGDFDMLSPFFVDFLAALPLAEARTRKYYGHGGAFFSETSYAWGTYTAGDYGFDRQNKPDGFAVNTYIRHYWSGGLELAVMMLDQYAITGSHRFLTDTLLPLAKAITLFYDRHWQRGPNGKIKFDTTQSLETWQETVNPLPEIAGLKYVLGRLLELPTNSTTAAQRTTWSKTLAALPPIPMITRNDSTFLLPADTFGAKSNVEDPELYAVFPYRLFGIGQPDLRTGLNTFAVREFRENRCWWQDEIQAACLGLAPEAAARLTKRFADNNKEFRFPAMWGPNNDEIPDLDHGGVGQMALQYMLVQSDKDTIRLFPAWPRFWDVSFKLHAPKGTIIEGELHGGKLSNLVVTPQSRRKDLIIMPLQ